MVGWGRDGGGGVGGKCGVGGGGGGAVGDVSPRVEHPKIRKKSLSVTTVLQPIADQPI